MLEVTPQSSRRELHLGVEGVGRAPTTGVNGAGLSALHELQQRGLSTRKLACICISKPG